MIAKNPQRVYHTQNETFNGKKDRQIEINCRTIGKRLDFFSTERRRRGPVLIYDSEN